MDAATVMRESEIRALDLLNQPMPDVLQRIVRLAAQVTNSAGAAINIITGTTQHTLVTTDSAPSTCPAEDSFCARIVRETERHHLIPDARRDDRFREHAATRSGVVVTYAASQLVTPSEVPIGTLCVFNPDRAEISAEMMHVLAELADAAMDVLEARRQHDELQESMVELADRQRELRRSNEHLAAFAGQVSHDIQGPLGGVLMALEMLAETLGQEPDAASRPEAMFLRTALSSAGRMQATVNGLMDFAMLGGTIAPVRLDMRAVVADAVMDLAAHSGSSQIVIEELPAVWGDEVQIRAVIQNLLANAVKYAGDVPDPRIVVGGATQNGRSRVWVRDNGPGVPTAQREAIFGLLVRGQGADDSGAAGLGIGLATCRRIIQAHGGDIGVGDSPGGGAEFWLELPNPARPATPGGAHAGPNPETSRVAGQ